jgi:hypothetical protein
MRGLVLTLAVVACDRAPMAPTIAAHEKVSEHGRAALRRDELEQRATCVQEAHAARGVDPAIRVVRLEVQGM